MTRAVADKRGARALVQTLKRLGAPRRAGRTLAAGPQGHELGRALAEILDPVELILLHQTPASARARFRTLPDDVSTLARAQPGSFDLVVVGGGLDAGELSFIRETIGSLAELLRPGGHLAAVIDTLAAPTPNEPGAALDALLFPQLARLGSLGETAEARAPLPPSAWELIVQDAGLEIAAELSSEQTSGLDGMMIEHAPRLSVYDAQEISRGQTYLLARKSGDPA